MNGFPNRDEGMVGKPAILPFSLEDELQGVSGGGFEMSEEPLGEKVVVARDARLTTGQNPASVIGVVKAVKKTIKKERDVVRNACSATSKLPRPS